jgi:hypothetical protein
MTFGYWEPHSSSIDFCETNYLHSQYISEVHNTWSSILGLSLFGLMGLILINHTQETRYTLAYSVLVFIGLGSAGLHSTLHWILQSADELPMMYLTCSLLYLTAEYDSPIGKPNYPRLPKTLLLFAIANTIIYFCFQRFYLVFIFTFVAETVITLSYILQLILDKASSVPAKDDKRNDRQASSESFDRKNREHYSYNLKIHRCEETSRLIRKMGNIVLVSLFSGFFPFWLLDMMQCHNFVHITDEIFFGMTPHVLWHFCAGFSAYVCILVLEVIRMEQLDIPYEARFILLFFPLVRRIDSQ